MDTLLDILAALGCLVLVVILPLALVGRAIVLLMGDAMGAAFGEK